MEALLGAAPRGRDVRIVGAHVSGSTARINERQTDPHSVSSVMCIEKKKKTQNALSYQLFLFLSLIFAKLSLIFNDNRADN